MKILLIHYRYFEASGPEKYLFNVSKLLQQRGHQVVPFSLNYSQNKKTPFSKYFSNPVISEFHIHKHKKSISILKKLKIIINSFFNREVYSKLFNLIEAEKPDIAYVLQYGTKLSTSIFDACSHSKVPIILRLSDFNLVCSKNILFRAGEICTKCIENKFSSVKYKCVHDSLIQSFIYFLVQKYNQLKHFEQQIHTFIAPSQFTIDTIKSCEQFSKRNFQHIPTFIENSQRSQKIVSRKFDITDGLKLCYWGRIDEDKGIDVLIDAIKIVSQKGLKISLDIIGDTSSEFAKKQILRTKELGLSNIIFRGYIPNQQIAELITNIHFSVIPSKWYDNMPNSLIESCLSSIPVIVSKIGSLAELITNNHNGITFQPNNDASLASTIESLYNITEDKYQSLSTNALNWILEYSDKNKHYNRLINVFNEAINEKNNN